MVSGFLPHHVNCPSYMCSCHDTISHIIIQTRGPSLEAETMVSWFWLSGLQNCWLKKVLFIKVSSLGFHYSNRQTNGSNNDLKPWKILYAGFWIEEKLNNSRLIKYWGKNEKSWIVPLTIHPNNQLGGLIVQPFRIRKHLLCYNTCSAESLWFRRMWST